MAKRRRGPKPTQRLAYTPTGLEVQSLSTASSRGYHSATSARESGRSLGQSGSADYHLRGDLTTIRGESQRFDRDNGIYQAMLSRMLDVILGDGLTLQSKCKNKTVGTKVEKLWNEFWAKPELRGLDSGAQIERLLLRHEWVDGDDGLIKDEESGLLQMVEADQIDSNITALGDEPVELGIHLSKLGKPLNYYIAPYDRWGMPQPSQATPVKAADFIYLANRRRISQTRGEPVMQCNFSMFHRINDVCDSEAIAWQLLTKLAIAIIRKTGDESDEATSEADEGASEASITDRIHDLTEGLILHLEPGEDAKGIERNIPGGNFTESIKTFLRLLGMPFGLSLEFVLLIWSDTNYSSGRASIKQVERACRPWLNQLRVALGEVFRWKVRQWIKADELSARADIFDHEFFPNPYPFIDPGKEEDARNKRLEGGSTSPTREAKSQGLDDDELVAEQEADLRKRAEAAARLNKKFPDEDFTTADFTMFVEKRKKSNPGRPAGEDATAKTPRREEK